MSYANVFFNRNKSSIHLWEYVNGERIYSKHDAPIYFYIDNKEGEYTSIFGDTAKKIECKNHSEMKERSQTYKEMGKKIFESDVPTETKFIVNRYLGKELTIPKFDIHFFDIEVHSEEGFPRPEEANYPITIITIWSTKHNKYFIFAEKDFAVDFLKDDETCEKFVFETENDLLEGFIRWFFDNTPDILSGWSSNSFDIPYIVNRIKNTLGDKWVKRLSPIGIVNEVESKVGKGSGMHVETRYVIAGVNCLDMLEVYKNYTFSDRENYKLGYIAGLEIGATKVAYEGTLIDLYRNWQKYVSYNIQDVRLLRDLENKLGYLHLLMSFCYGCRVPFDQFNKTTRVLDGAFISQLAQDNIILPDVNRSIQDIQYPGGYVKDPERGVHEWVISYDATSLYPSIMMGWNISPETKVAVLNKEYVGNVVRAAMGKSYEDIEFSLQSGTTFNLDSIGRNTSQIADWIFTNNENSLKLVNEKGGIHGIFNEVFVDNIRKKLLGVEVENLDVYWNNEKITTEEVVQRIKDNKFCLSANGVIYRQDKAGIVPKFVKEWFDKRNAYKVKMLDAEKAGNKEDKNKYNLLQLNYKILINAVYGYLGTCYSRFYDFDNAAAVTMNGQFIIKEASDSVSNFFSTWESSDIGKKLKATNCGSIVIGNDTDSGYFSMGNILKNIGVFDITKKTDQEVKNFIMFNKFVNNDVIFNEETKDDKKIYNIKPEYEKEEKSCKSIQNLIGNILKRSMEKLSMKSFNCVENKIYFKRESISRRAVFLQKKRYAMWVLNNEGVETDKIKVTGIEIVRSSTPLIIQDVLEDIVFTMLKTVDYKTVEKMIRDFKPEFMKSSTEKIAFPKTVHNLKEYTEKWNNGDRKGTPVHVRAAILYNKILHKDKKLRSLYDFIYTDGKMKFVYLKTNSENIENVMGFAEVLPKEFNLDANVDKEMQFDKTFIKPLLSIFDAFGWKFPDLNTSDISDLFEF